MTQSRRINITLQGKVAKCMIVGPLGTQRVSDPSKNRVKNMPQIKGG